MPPSNSNPLALLQQLCDQYLDRDLKRDEVIQMRKATSQHLVPLMEHSRKIFLLGSFDDNEKERVKLVQNVFDSLYRIRGSSQARVYTMDEIPGQDIWINLDFKFRLLADISDYIVGVVEHDEGGFMFEQGILATNPDYRKRTRLLKREYGTTEREYAHYSAMQSEGLFEELDSRDQLFRWQDGGDLVEKTEDIFRDIESEDYRHESNR